MHDTFNYLKPRENCRNVP
uniref:Uncharacterized protein n=1 Tax=Rhizophora mucronata TaxID=61149 RepID=A0A2P2R4G8_RHIMU